MAVIVIFVPNVSNAALASQVPELKYGRRKCDLARCDLNFELLSPSRKGNECTVLSYGGTNLVRSQTWCVIVKRLDFLQ